MSKTLIIGFNGSPKKDGNTAFLLREALAAAQEQGAQTEIVHVGQVLAGLANPFCSQCQEVCEAQCVKDKALGEVFELIRRCDGVILASPVYFGTVSAQLKALWDKTRLLRKEQALYNVVGGALAVGASRFGGQETTINALHQMMLVQGMTIVGDGFGGEGCGHHGAAGQRPAENDTFAVRQARVLGKRVAEVAMATSHLRIRK